MLTVHACDLGRYLANRKSAFSSQKRSNKNKSRGFFGQLDVHFGILTSIVQAFNRCLLADTGVTPIPAQGLWQLPCQGAKQCCNT